MPRKKIALVTGANGFVGSHLSLALTKQGIRVIGFAHSKKKLFNNQFFPSGLFVQVAGDVRDRRGLQNIFSQYKPSYCFHLAAKATVEEGQEEPAETYDVNINGAVNILDLSRIYKLEKVIIASTSHVYGNNPNVPFIEEYFPQPSRPYETSKTCVDLIAQSYADSYSMFVEIPRFVNIYGPGDTNFTRVIPKLMKKIILEGKVEIWGGEIIRDYLYIDDAISAYLCLIKENCIVKNKIVNFGSGKPLSVQQLVEKIIKISHKNITIKIKRKMERELEVEKQYVLSEKAYKYFHWRPKITLNKGLSRTFFWYKKYFS